MKLAFGVLDLPDAPFATLEERWKMVEDLGFDQLWLADQTADFRNPSGPWVDGWIALTVMARHTSRIRIGPLVSNPIMRHPVILAKQVVAVDELSAGRLELGLGTGIAPFDHEALGTHFWSPKERAGRFDEYVRVLDELLTSGGDPYPFGYRASMARARLGSCPARCSGPARRSPWPGSRRPSAGSPPSGPTAGTPTGRSAPPSRRSSRSPGTQVQELDRACEAGGRDPSTLRRSVLLFEALDPWESPVAFEDVVNRFAEIGFREFVVFWPGDDRRADLEDLARRAFPALPRATGVILVHAGNRVDAPDRDAAPRFPPSQVEFVRFRLSRLLDVLRPEVVSAAAAGADLVLLEEALRLRLQVHVVLPCARDRFLEASVADLGDEWAHRYERVVAALAHSKGSRLIEHDEAIDGAGLRRGNGHLLDHAQALAAGRQPAQGVLALAVRPGVGEDPPSVTDDFVEQGRLRRLTVIDIDPRLARSEMRRAFVAMPFGTKGQGPQAVDCDATFGKLIVPALEDADLLWERADRQLDRGLIHVGMIEQLGQRRRGGGRHRN